MYAKIIQRMTQTMINGRPEGVMLTEVLCKCKGEKPVLVPIAECFECEHNDKDHPLFKMGFAVKCNGEETVVEPKNETEGENK